MTIYLGFLLTGELVQNQLLAFNPVVVRWEAYVAVENDDCCLVSPQFLLR